MKTIDLATACKPLSEYASQLGDEVLVLVSDKTPIAALVSLKEVDRECLSLSTNPEFLALIDKARQEFRDGKTMSFEAMRRAVEKMP
jgi:hypothetical protein